jgi:hypothetical protein
MSATAIFSFNHLAWDTLKGHIKNPGTIIPGLTADALAEFMAKGQVTHYENGSAMIEWKDVEWDPRMHPRTPEREFFPTCCAKMPAGGEYSWIILGDHPWKTFAMASHGAATGCRDLPILKFQCSADITSHYAPIPNVFDTCEKVLGYLGRNGKFPDGFGDNIEDWYMEDTNLELAVPLAAARYRLLPADSDMWDFNINGTTPAHIAAKYGALPDGFSDWALEDEEGTSVAHVAAEWNELPSDFDQWSIGADTWTSVAHCAAEHGTIPDFFPKELWYMKDATGRTVAQVAKEWGHLPEDISLYGPEDIGTLWWNADDEAEAKQWAQDFTAKGATNVKLMDPDPNTGVIGVTFDLPKGKANEILGYTPDEEEWLVKEEPGVKPKMGM